MKNKLFQFFWYKIGKKIIPRKEKSESLTSLDSYGRQMYYQIKSAQLIGLGLVIFGDSNGEVLKEQDSMSKFPKVTVNLAIGGTRADTWLSFFKDSEWGIKVYELIKNKKCVINLGGNHVLQNSMDNLDSSIKALSEMFTDTYWITAPKIWSNLLPIPDINKKLLLTNKTIKKYAKGKVIDIEPFTGKLDSDLPYWFVQQDAVHFSHEFDIKVRIPIIIATVYKKV